MARVLLVEDDLEVGEVVQAMLRDGGHVVEWVTRGEAAVPLFQNGRFDLVLCDMHLPGKTGAEVIADARNASVAVPAILMSGSYPRETGGAHIDPPLLLRQSGATAGTAIIAKPFRKHEILALIDDCIAKADQTRQ